VEWVIECVRDGDKIDERIERFQQGGKCHIWITSGEIKDYIILDFRTSKPLKAGSRLYLSIPLGLMNANKLDHFSFLYFIVFSHNYTRYQIYDASAQPVGEEIALLR
jgi:hypothetical protein